MNKKELRKEIRNRKQQYTQEELKKLSEPIINRLRHHPKLIEAKTIMLYHSLPDEVFTISSTKSCVKTSSGNEW